MSLSTPMIIIWYYTLPRSLARVSHGSIFAGALCSCNDERMFTIVQAKMELRDPQHLACSEIRAASLVDCAGTWSVFKKVRPHVCLRTW